MRTTDPEDPKGLVAQSFMIDGITLEECRSIFLDWALSLPEGLSAPEAARTLRARHSDKPANHPMLTVLAEAEVTPVTPRRRGGWSGRRRDT